MAFVFRAVILSVIFAGVVFTMYKLNTDGINKSLFHLDSSVGGEQGQRAFLVTDVEKFEWRSPQKISFLEKNTSGQWVPLEREKKINEILSLIAGLSYGELEQKGVASPLVFLRLQISGEMWAAQWDGLTLLWTEGPLKNTGAVLKEPLSRELFKGRFLFSAEQSVDLCHNRVKKIRITIQSKEYEIFQNKRGWDLLSKKSLKTVSMDPIFIEKWLIKTCSLELVSTLDPAFVPPVPAAVDRLTWTYIDNSEWDFFSLEKDLVMQNDRAIILKGYKSLFEDLKNQIEKTQP